MTEPEEPSSFFWQPIGGTMLDNSKGKFCGRAAASLLLLLALAGCANTARNVTSTAEFLYPGTEEPTVSGTPVLTLPVSVGVAFVPGTSGFAPSRLPVFVARAAGLSRGSMITEKQKVDLMHIVAGRFARYPFVRDVAIIPSDYLKLKGGFENIDQIRAMYGVDVVVLISYDQTQFTDQGALSLVNLTIVGAYVVPSEKNETETMLEAVVLDIGSRKMLFRAPGTSQVKGISTLVNQSQVLRADSEQGFRRAAENMVENLESQLAAFREKIKGSPKEYRVIRPEGYKDN
jgi:rhombotail lipoprotein